MLEISSSVEKLLPSTVKTALSKLSTEKQSLFEEEFKKKAKSPTTAYICYFCLSVHYFYLGKPGKNILFWLTSGGLLIWGVIDLFTLGNRVKEHNEDTSKAILRDMKLMDA